MKIYQSISALFSPERTISGQSPPAPAATSSILEPPAPNPVVDVNIPLVFPTGDELDLEDEFMDPEESKVDPKRKFQGEDGPIPDLEKLLAMADVVIAQEKGQAGSDAKKVKA